MDICNMKAFVVQTQTQRQNHFLRAFLLFVIIKAPGGRTAGSAYSPCSFHKPNTEFFVIIFQPFPLWEFCKEQRTFPLK